MADVHHLVRIESSGNQRFIFATNKLRENLGASQLICELDERVRTIALTTNATVLQCGAGLSLLLVPSKDAAERLVRETTLWALVEAPGLAVRGTVSEPFSLSEVRLDEVIDQSFMSLHEVAVNSPGPEARFLRLPIVAECRTSGLPAAALKHGEEQSYVSIAKREAATRAVKRLQQLDRGLCPSIDDLDRRFGAEWLAVIHADGNAIGDLFLHLSEADTASRTADWNRNFIARYAALSAAIDDVTKGALRDAFAVLPLTLQDQKPLVPIVLGGDDLTVVIEGRFARQFTTAYLTAFASRAAGHHAILAVAPQGITASAGVAIVKPHFPFATAYDLADELTTSAKSAKRHQLNNPSAFDAMVVKDSTVGGLAETRTRLTRIEMSDAVGETTIDLFGGPFLLHSQPGHEWAEQHSLADLDRWITLLTATAPAGDGREAPAIPRTQVARLRQAAHQSVADAEAVLGVIRHRHGPKAIGLPGLNAMFSKSVSGHRTTALLDALEFVDVEMERRS